MLKKIVYIVISGLLLTAPAFAQDRPPLRIGWVFAMANAPALIAEKKGFYQQEGLNVELKSFGDGPVIQQALAAKELDAAYIGAPPVYQWFARGLKGQIIAKVNTGQAALITSEKSPISSLSDLRGKRVAGLSKGSGMDVLLRGLVLKQQAGLTADRDVNIIAMPAGNMLAALRQGTVDAAFTWEPFVSEALLRNDAKLLMDVNQVQPNYPWYVLMALPEMLEQRPDEVIKLLKAHQKAIDFINRHPDEADGIIAAEFKLHDIELVSGKVIPAAAIVKEARKRLSWSAALTRNDMAFIQRLMDDSLALGYLQQPMKADQVVDTRWLVKSGIQTQP